MRAVGVISALLHRSCTEILTICAIRAKRLHVTGREQGHDKPSPAPTDPMS